MSENRLTELLADRALFGLDEIETEELNQLTGMTNEDHDHSFEIAAALVDLSMTTPETLPESLEKKLALQGRATLSGTNDSSMGTGSTGAEKKTTEPSPIDRSNEPATSAEVLPASSDPVSPSHSNRVREIVAWGCAAAIGFIALMVWTNNRADIKQLQNDLAQATDKQGDLEQEIDKRTKANDQLRQEVVSWKLSSSQKDSIIKAKDKTLEEQRVMIAALQKSPNAKDLYEQLVKSDETIQWKWSPFKDKETAATGDVVWDEKEQKGVMRLVNLPVNDPNTSQYQLWIAEADGRPQPVDGGVFDIKKAGEVFITIDAKLVATTPKFFAITEEEPKGVVVSKLTRAPLIALPGTESNQ